MRVIVDIGSGPMPTFLIQWISEHVWGKKSSITATYGGIKETDLYVCLDNNPDMLGYGKKYVQKFPHRAKAVNGTLQYILANAAALPFPDGVADAVLATNFFCLPRDAWRDGGMDEREARRRELPRFTGVERKGLSDEEKFRIADEIIRILKPGGDLVVSHYQTFRHAVPSMVYLKNHVHLRMAFETITHEPDPKRWPNGGVEQRYTRARS
jgi:SAM-dependent methyltransferase